MQRDRKCVLIVSGSTGRTCTSVLQAALAHFKNHHVDVQTFPQVRSARRMRSIVRRADRLGAAICHSVVHPSVRRALSEESRRLGVQTVDVLGPALSFLEDHLEIKAVRTPGLSARLHKEQFDRIEATSFAASHDDGARLNELDKADVVLVGVSRTSKTVTSFYLAFRGIRAANVPLVPGANPPEQLLDLDNRKVIGLTMATKRLITLREARAETWGKPPPAEYTMEREVSSELTEATRLMKRHKWRTIDVTTISIEEVGKQVMSMISSH